jgi:hypothetical protein
MFILISGFAYFSNSFFEIFFDNIPLICLNNFIISIILHNILFLKDADDRSKKHFIKYYVQIPLILLLSFSSIKQQLKILKFISPHNILLNVLLWLFLFIKCYDESTDYEMYDINKDETKISLYYIVKKICLIPIITTFHLCWYVTKMYSVRVIFGKKLLFYLGFSVLSILSRSILIKIVNKKLSKNSNK